MHLLHPFPMSKHGFVYVGSGENAILILSRFDLERLLEELQLTLPRSLPSNWGAFGLCFIKMRVESYAYDFNPPKIIQFVFYASMSKKRLRSTFFPPW